MRWFAAHVVMMVEMKGQEQEIYPVWENIVLIQADSEEDAYRQAEDLGHQQEGDDDGSFRWGEKSATWVFSGVRKLTECLLFDERPDAGDEISSTEFQFKSKASVRQFAEGKAVETLVNDKYHAMSLGEKKSEPNNPKKRASGERDSARKPA